MKRFLTSAIALGLAGCAYPDDMRPSRISSPEVQVYPVPAPTYAQTAPAVSSFSVPAPEATYTPVPSALAYFEKPSSIKILDEQKVATEEIVVWQSASEPAFKTVKVAKGDTLYSLARKHNAKVFEVAQANNLSAPFTLAVGSTIKIPEGTAESQKEATYFMPSLSTGTAFVEEPAPNRREVVVQKGDTLYSIARANNVPVKDLIEANEVKPPYTLAVGQSLKLPAAAFYVVRKGDTLYSISRKFGLNLKSLAQINKIKEPFTLSEGQKIRLSAATVAAEGAPPARAETKKNVIEAKNNKLAVVAAPAPAPAPVKPSAPADAKPSDTRPAPTLTMPSVETAAPREVAEPAFERPAPMASNKFAWPVKGRVIATFGAKAGSNRNDGINIAAALGSPVMAAENGVVVYAGNELKGLGNLVIIRHERGFMSIYAHNEKILAKKGQHVSRGEKIAEVGRSGRVSTPQFHFEIRQRTKSIDPMGVLEKG